MLRALLALSLPFSYYDYGNYTRGLEYEDGSSSRSGPRVGARARSHTAKSGER